MAQHCRRGKPLAEGQRSNDATSHLVEAMDARLDTPTCASWLNLVEVWFAIIERQAIHRGTFASVGDLTTAIRTFINGWNDRRHPFTWTKTARRYGPGIAAHELDRIFERFYRAEAATPGHPGAGIGLAIVKELIEARGGSVSVHSRQHGTEFCLRPPSATG